MHDHSASPFPPAHAAPDDEAERVAALRGTGLLDSAPEEAYDEITELAANICDAPVCLISLVDEARQWFKSARGIGCRQTERGDSICTYTIRQDAPLVVDDLAADERFASSSLVREGIRIRAYAGVPIRGPQGHRLGSLCVLDFVPRRFTRAHVRALRSLARQVETQIALRQEMAAKSLLMEQLGDSHRRFQTFMDHSPVAAFIKDKDGRMCWYNQRLANLYGISPEAWLGKTDFEIWPEASAAAYRAVDQAVLAGRGDVELEETSPGPNGTTVHWKTCKFAFTDASGEHYVAGVAVDLTRERAREAELKEVTKRLQLANEELLRVAMLDQLTQVGNRRSFDLALERNFAAARKENGRLSLILLDIDHFKRLNDRYGHAYGDEVLRGVGSVLRGAVRATDRVCRYGGEEFAILLPSTGAEQALELARRICAAVEEHAFPEGPVTMSAGVAGLHGAMTSGVALVSDSDAALYAAKRAGRNRALLSSELNATNAAESSVEAAPAVPEELEACSSGCGLVWAAA